MSKLYLGVNIKSLTSEYWNDNHHFLSMRYKNEEIQEFAHALFLLSVRNFQNVFEVLYTLSDIFYENFNDDLLYAFSDKNIIELRLSSADRILLFTLVVMNNNDLLFVV